MNTLTVFTPTFNRKHTITRTFESLCRQTCKDFDWLIIDDGSSDGTREWVEGLGEKIKHNGFVYDWMGRVSDCIDENHFVIEHKHIDSEVPLRIEYVYKPNGGLYTGYNVAYSVIKTELNVCIDSDDYMPDNSVENILKKWNSRNRVKEYCGIRGLDFNVSTKDAIGGYLDECESEGYYEEMNHQGDTKEVMRTDLMKNVSPMIGFEGERDFNPSYMLRQVFDKYPILVDNTNYCWVEYQTGADSMSQGIYRQYVKSPKSYAKFRILLMTLKHGNSIIKKFRNCGHYVSSCIFSKDKLWLNNSPLPILTFLSIPLGIIINIIIRKKTNG